MKKQLLILTALLAAFTAQSQCFEYDCSDAENNAIIGDLSPSYHGSTCFSGEGEISSGVNVNNWDFLAFTTDAEIDMKQVINFGHDGKYIFVNGIVSFKKWHMTGSDTVFIKSGITQVEDIVSNNSFEDEYNVVSVDDGAEFYLGGIRLDPSISTVTYSIAGGTGNVIKVIRGCEDEPLPITSDLTGNMIDCDNVELIWQADVIDFELQARNNETEWNAISTQNTGKYASKIKEATYYRLKVDSKYSSVYYANPTCKTGIEVYPNPVRNYVIINSGYPILSVNITDLSGRTIMNTTDKNISLSHLTSGTYYITVITESDTKTEKIVLIK